MKKLILIGVVALLAACSAKEGSEYVGTFKSEKRNLMIERNDSTFLIKATTTANGRTVSLPAVYRDGLLYISNGFGETGATLVKDRDVLLVENVKYMRVK